MGEGGSPVD